MVAIAKKVKVVHDTKMPQADPDTGDTMARVTIVAGGKTFSSNVTAPRGGGPRPFSQESVEKKFRMATRYAASREQQDQLIVAVIRARGGNAEVLEKCLVEMVFDQQ